MTPSPNPNIHHNPTPHTNPNQHPDIRPGPVQAQEYRHECEREGQERERLGRLADSSSAGHGEEVARLQSLLEAQVLQPLSTVP